MQFKNVILGRRSVRRYKDKQVPLELVGEVIDLARFSPSSGNLQNWKFVIVTDQEKREQIADACLQQNWMNEAPVLVVVCNDYEDVKDHYGKLGKMYSIQNCANVAFAITLVAYDKGLGSCWVGGFDSEAVQRVLEIPDNMDPEVIITLGYSDETKEPSIREDPRYLTYLGKWGQVYKKFPSHIEQFQRKIGQVKKQIKKIKKKS